MGTHPFAPPALLLPAIIQMEDMPTLPTPRWRQRGKCFGLRAPGLQSRHVQQGCLGSRRSDVDNGQRQTGFVTRQINPAERDRGVRWAGYWIRTARWSCVGSQIPKVSRRGAGNERMAALKSGRRERGYARERRSGLERGHPATMWAPVTCGIM